MLVLPGGSPGEIRLVACLLVGLLPLELLLAAPQPLSPRARISQFARQLIAARVAEALILVSIRSRRLGEHPLDLVANRRVGTRRLRRGVTSQQAAVERHYSHRHQPCLRAQRKHLHERLGQRLLVTGAKARDRRMIGHLIGRDHTESDVLTTAPLDSAARALADR